MGDAELIKTNEELEEEIKHEIDFDLQCSRSLEQVVSTLLRTRHEVKRREVIAEAELARLQIRLQAVKDQKSMMKSSTQGNLSVRPSCDTEEAVHASIAAQAAILDALAKGFCIPASKKD